SRLGAPRARTRAPRSACLARGRGRARAAPATPRRVLCGVLDPLVPPGPQPSPRLIELADRMIRVTFLGTAASRPTVGRNVSAVLLNRHGELLLFDCGEGTQRQMMRFQTGFSIDDVFFTHLHADHFLGIIGLLRTMGLQGRTEPIRLWAPEGSRQILHDAVNLGVERVPFDIEIIELSPGERIERGDYEIVPYRTMHGGRSLG